MAEPLPGGGEEPLVGANPHDRLRDSEADDFRVGQDPSCIAGPPRQEIIGDAEHSNQQQVELGEHRGPLGSTARLGTADFDLAAVGPYKAVELLI